MRGVKRTIRGMVLVVAIAATAGAQPNVRRATNLAALMAFPGFYHEHPITIVAKVAIEKDQLRASDDNGSVRLIFKGGSAPDGLDEIRGEFWDIGRMKPDEPRLSGYDLRGLFGIDP